MNVISVPNYWELDGTWKMVANITSCFIAIGLAIMFMSRHGDMSIVMLFMWPLILPLFNFNKGPEFASMMKFLTFAMIFEFFILFQVIDRGIAIADPMFFLGYALMLLALVVQVFITTEEYHWLSFRGDRRVVRLYLLCSVALCVIYWLFEKDYILQMDDIMDRIGIGILLPVGFFLFPMLTFAYSRRTGFSTVWLLLGVTSLILVFLSYPMQYSSDYPNYSQMFRVLEILTIIGLFISVIFKRRLEDNNQGWIPKNAYGKV
ncbi:MAG: hypothetical protein RBR71_11545 [Gudongella sp.]|nr:hypothetical protein [Gudongella sp.]